MNKKVLKIILKDLVELLKSIASFSPLPILIILFIYPLRAIFEAENIYREEMNRVYFEELLDEDVRFFRT